MSYIVAIDQGTTSTRSIVFDGDMKPLNTSQKELESLIGFCIPLISSVCLLFVNHDGIAAVSSAVFRQ